MNKLISIVMSVLTFYVGYFSPYFPSDMINYEVFENLKYGSGERNVVDVYVPDEAYEREYNGCILFIHGGSWSNGDKKEMASRCIEMAKKGYITATMNYTLYSVDTASEFTVDVMLDEIGMALKKVQVFCSRKGLNITKAATSGFSSGGHISMLYSYSRAESSPVELVFTANMVSPFDLSYEVWGDLCPVIVSGLSGKTVTKNMAKSGTAAKTIASVSPITYVTKDSLPSLFAYGGKDVMVPSGNGDAVKKKFDSVGAEYDFILYPNSNHTLLSDPDQNRLYTSTLKKYCETYFGY